MKMIHKISILILVILTATSVSCRPGQVAVDTEVPPVPVITANPEFGTITEWHRTTCTLRSPLEAGVSFGTGGRIIELTADEGDLVVAGQYLGKVDTSILAAQLNAVLSSINVSESQAESADSMIAASEAQVEQARAAAELAETNFQRFQALYEDGVATEAEFEQIELAYESAKLGLDAALDGLGATRAQADAAHAGVQATRSQASQFREMIDDGSIYAPFGGRIVERWSDPGVMVSPGQPVYRLVGEGEDVSDRLEAVLYVPEQVMGMVLPGSELLIELASCDRTVETVVDRTGGEVRDGDRMLEVIGYLEKDSLCIMPGMFGVVMIPLQRHTDALLIPEPAILPFEDVKVVYIADGNVAHRREVETGLYEGGMVEILSGIAADDDVIVAGHTFLKEGATIDIRVQDEVPSGDEPAETGVTE